MHDTRELTLADDRPNPGERFASAAVVSSASNSLWAIVLPVALLVLVQAAICWKALPTSLAGRVDFRAFYTAGYLVAHGHSHELFSWAAQQQAQHGLFPPGYRDLPFLYPPYIAPFFAPLAELPYRAAFFLFLAVNLLCLALVARLLCARVKPLKTLPAPLQFGLAAAFFPVSMALMQGQISFLLLLVYVVFAILVQRGEHFASGLVLAVALVKFQIALPVALLFLLWGFFRLIAGFAAGAVMLGLVSTAITGVHGLAEYWRGTSAMASRTLLDPGAAKLRYGMFAADMPNLHGFFFLLAHGRPWGTVFAAVTSVAVMAWAWRQRPSIAVALPAAMLVSYHMQAYDLVLVLLPLALVLRSKTPATKWLVPGSIVLLTAPVAAVLVVKGLSAVMMLGVVCVLLAAANCVGEFQPAAPKGARHSYS